MKSLYLRIYATVVVVLLLFALVSGWIVERHLDDERARNEQVAGDRLAAWAELVGNSLPGADTSAEVQLAALRDWSQRLRVPLALDDAKGQRVGTSESFERRMLDGVRPFSFKLDDGRTLLTMRPGPRQGGGRRGGPGGEPRGPGDEARGPGGEARGPGGELRGPGGELRGPGGDERGWRPPPPWPMLFPGLPRSAGLAIILVVLFLAIAAGAYPVVRRLTRRLEALKRGVEQFGAGALDHRVAISGADEVAAVAASFNIAAARVEALVQSHRSLLANASHELRSPLARMKMAVSMLAEATPAERDTLKREIDKNVAELDGLVEEVLLASRLDVAENALHRDRVDLLAVAAEEAARVGAHVESTRSVHVDGDERLLRRAIRNLLENAQRYGGGEVEIGLGHVAVRGRDFVSLEVCDRGPGVPEAMRERIFEPFFRLPGHAEQAGGVGLGLALVKQIAARHGGNVRCEGRAGGGSRFVIEIPAA
jgi:signal transduction histidine kinase